MNETELDKLLIEEAKNYLGSYQLCMDLLHLRQYERRRAKEFDEPCGSEDILKGNELYWRARMREIEAFVASLRNSSEKLILYYRFIRGQSVQYSSDFLGISRRTGYRRYNKGLLTVGKILLRTKRIKLEDLTQNGGSVTE